MLCLNRKRNLPIIVFFATIFGLIIIPVIKGNFPNNWLRSSELIAQVYTDPAGFVKGTAYKNTYTLMSVPLNWSSALINEGIGVMLAENLTGAAIRTDADEIYKYDPDSQSYEIAWLVAGTGGPFDGKWVDASAPTPQESTMVLAPGDAFLVCRKNTGGDTAEIIFLGWVPTIQQTDVVIKTGWNPVSYPYPTPMDINETSLYDDGAHGSFSRDAADEVLEWDPVTQQYKVAWLVDGTSTGLDGTWIDAFTGTSSDIVFTPTKGYWYNRKTGGGGPFTWQVAKPY